MVSRKGPSDPNLAQSKNIGKQVRHGSPTVHLDWKAKIRRAPSHAPAATAQATARPAPPWRNRAGRPSSRQSKRRSRHSSSYVAGLVIRTCNSIKCIRMHDAPRRTATANTALAVTAVGCDLNLTKRPRRLACGGAHMHRAGAGAPSRLSCPPTT